MEQISHKWSARLKGMAFLVGKRWQVDDGVLSVGLVQRSVDILPSTSRKGVLVEECGLGEFNGGVNVVEITDENFQIIRNFNSEMKFTLSVILDHFFVRAEELTKHVRNVIYMV